MLYICRGEHEAVKKCHLKLENLFTSTSLVFRDLNRTIAERFLPNDIFNVISMWGKCTDCTHKL